MIRTTAAVLAGFSGGVSAGVISTSFESSPELPEGTEVFTIGEGLMSATFTGGETNFRGDPSLYNDGLQSWLIAGGGQVGTIDFAAPALEVSFYAGNGGNGQSTIEVFASAGNLIDTATVTASTLTGDDPDAFFSFAADDIGSITLTNPAAADPPYETFVDSFNANVTPTPGSVVALGLAGAFAARRRR